MAGLASDWAMARRRPKEHRRKVDAATRCSAVCPHTDLTSNQSRRKNLQIQTRYKWSYKAGVPINQVSQ